MYIYIFFRLSDINQCVSDLENGTPHIRNIESDNEIVENAVEVITAIIARCINKAKKRNCEGCINCLPNQQDHMCSVQTHMEAVVQFFDDAYNSATINLINAIFIMDGLPIPPLNIQAIKEHYRKDMKQRLMIKLESMTSGDLLVSRCVLYMQPLFQFVA